MDRIAFIVDSWVGDKNVEEERESGLLEVGGTMYLFCEESWMEI